MHDRIDKIKKAIKLAAMASRTTGNKYHDELAQDTLKRYCAKHEIDEKTLNSLHPVEHHHTYASNFECELFLMIGIKVAEDKNMLNDIGIVINGNEFTYTGPGFFYDEVFPLFSKLLRKYQITRDDIKSRISQQQQHRGMYNIVGYTGSSITITSNIIQPSIKYSEVAFYNAFLIKYDLIAKCVIDKIKKDNNDPQNQRQVGETQNQINEIFQMFNKEPVNDQID